MKTPPIPPAALTQHVAIVGKTGSGKTSTAKLAIEQVVAEDGRGGPLRATELLFPNGLR